MRVWYIRRVLHMDSFNIFLYGTIKFRKWYQVFGLRLKFITSSGVVSNLPSYVILLVTILQCWFMFQINDLPRPTFWNQSIKELGLGTYEKVITVCRKCVKCFSSISHDNVNLKMCGSNFWCTKPSLNRYVSFRFWTVQIISLKSTGLVSRKRRSVECLLSLLNCTNNFFEKWLSTGLVSRKRR